MASDTTTASPPIAPWVAALAQRIDDRLAVAYGPSNVRHYFTATFRSLIINAIIMTGLTPYMSAVLCCDFERLKVICANKGVEGPQSGDINATATDGHYIGKTALDMAEAVVGKENMVEVLRAHGAIRSSEFEKGG